MDELATPKQRSYIVALGGEIAEGLTKRDASTLIDSLKGTKGRRGRVRGSRAGYRTAFRGRCEDAPCCGHSECGFGAGSPGYGSSVGGVPYYGESRW